MLLTALGEDYVAVRQHLPDNLTEHDERGTLFEVGSFTGRHGTWTVAIAQVGTGNPAAAVQAERAIATFNPDVALFVGVAGGLHGVKPGDVVAADFVYSYESARAGQAFAPRGKTAPSTFKLVQRARAICRGTGWHARIRPAAQPGPAALVGPIAAGEKVVADRRSAIYRFLRENCSDALAVEMEGAGFLHGAYANGGVAAMVIRGISELVNGRYSRGEAAERPPAARHAAAFAFELLDNLDPASFSTPHWHRPPTVWSAAPGGGPNARSGARSLEPGAAPPRRMHGVPQLPPHFVDRPQDLNGLKTAVLRKGPAAGDRGTIGIVGVSGMGGIGKTALAIALAHDLEIQRSFPDGVVWLPLGQHPALPIRQAQLAEALGHPVAAFTDAERGRASLSAWAADKACLVILDDVWRAEHLAAFDVLGPGSRLAFTTRHAELVRGAGAHGFTVGRLDDDQAVALLARWADQPVDGLPDEAFDVAAECDRLALALAVAGAMVAGRTERWRLVLHRLRSADLDRLRADFPHYHQYPSVLAAIQASTDDLEPAERARYLWLAVFRDQGPVPRAAIEMLWASAGLDAYDAQGDLDRFVDRSLAAQDDAGRFSLHDLQMDFVCHQVGAGLAALHERLLGAYARHCPDGWPSGPDDGYFFEHLAHHLAAAGRADDLRSLLLDFRWLEAKLAAAGVTSLLADYDISPDEEDVRLIRRVLHLSAHILVKDRLQLASQLTGRLPEQHARGVGRLLAGAHAWSMVPWLRPTAASLVRPGGPLLRTVPTRDGSALAMARAVGGSTVVSANRDGVIALWQVEQGRERRILGAHGGQVEALALSPDGHRLASASRDGVLKLWQLDSDHTLRLLGVKRAPAMVRAVSSDGRWVIVQAADRSSAALLDLTGGAQPLALPHGEVVSAAAVTPDGRYVTTGITDGGLTLWDIRHPERPRATCRHSHPILAVAITPDGGRVVGGAIDGTVVVWDPRQEANPRQLRSHNEWIVALALAADGRRAVSASKDATLRLWDLEQADPRPVLPGHDSSVAAMAADPDGEQVVSLSIDGMIKTWTLEGRQLSAVRLQGGLGHTIAVAPGVRRAVQGSFEGDVHVLEFGGAVTRRTARLHDAPVNVVALTPDGRTGVSGSLGRLKVWDLGSFTEIRRAHGFGDKLRTLAVSTDCRRVVSGAKDGAIRIWDLEALPTPVATLRGHEGPANTVAVTPEGHWVLSGGEDATLRFWDVARKREVARFTADDGITACAIVSTNPWTFACGEGTGRLHILRLAGEPPATR